MRWKIRIAAGKHARCGVPMTVGLPDWRSPAPAALRVDSPCVRGGVAQVVSDEQGATLHFVLGELAAEAVAEFVADSSRLQPEAAGGVQVRKQEGDTVGICVGGQPFTTLHAGRQWARPFFFPVTGPAGVGMTRSYPIGAEVPGEDRDHPHHKSLYVAHGDVNGADIWSETAGHGTQSQEALQEAAGGPVTGVLRTKNSWLRANGEKLLTDLRTVRFYDVGADTRLLDLTLCLRADCGDVTFGDTKEGGLLSVRVAESMKETRGGVIENAYGAVTETECWGQAAPWVDYSGPVQGVTVGIAVFDHPRNPRYPTRWHVRGYGLFTANPFGLSHYKAGFETDGSLRLCAETAVTFRYRVFLHRGGVRDGRVRDAFLGYAVPPAAQAEAV